MLYASTKKHPNVIRIRIRMRDLIDTDVMPKAVDSTIQRYPCFSVTLKEKQQGEWVYA